MAAEQHDAGFIKPTLPVPAEKQLKVVLLGDPFTGKVNIRCSFKSLHPPKIVTRSQTTFELKYFLGVVILELLSVVTKFFRHTGIFECSINDKNNEPVLLDEEAEFSLSGEFFSTAV
jgi:hypothetical protein